MDREEMQLEKKNNIEHRMKKILAVSLAVGLVVGILVSSVIFWIGSAAGKEKVDSAKTQETQQKAVARETLGMQVVDAVEAAKLNAKTLASKQDEWKLTLVNTSYPLATDYKPELVEIAPDRKVDKRIEADLKEMLADAKKEGLNPYICSAYRDYEYQRKVFNETMVLWINDGYTPLDAYDETSKSVAIPGTSEHATGLALDITSAEFAELDERQAETPEAKWLAENCWKYGFILRYPPNKSDITGIIYEPWHYRYVGKETAKEITEQGVTLEEYLEDNKRSEQK